MQHGYTNTTTRTPGGVRKTYAGPGRGERARRERTALTALRGLIPVPEALGFDDGSSLVEFRPGTHGQDLLTSGRPHDVLSSCGTALRTLHEIDPSILFASSDRLGQVITHGDFGPNNILLDPASFAVTAILDWEFCALGAAIVDIAWCEWIVRMHHPDAIPALPDFFDAYEARPAWSLRQTAMLERCEWLRGFCERWQPDGPAVWLWKERAVITASWVE